MSAARCSLRRMGTWSSGSRVAGGVELTPPRPCSSGWRRRERTNEWILNFDWEHDYDLSKMTNETLDALEQPFVDFFATKTKAEISERAILDHIMIGAINNSEDLANHPQLQARSFFEEAWHEELGEKVTYCGPVLKASEAPLTLRRRPPLIGEHNEEVYRQELGLSVEELTALRHAGVI